MASGGEDFDVHVVKGKECRHCKRKPARIVVNYYAGTNSCRDCGAVFHEPVVDYSHEERRSIKNDDGNEKDHTRTSASVTMMQDEGLSTKIGKGGPRAFSSNAERRMQERKAKAISPVDRLLKDGYKLIYDMASALDLAATIIHTAKLTLRDFVQTKSKAGDGVEGGISLRPSSARNTNMPEHAATAVFLACKINNAPIPLAELSKRLQIRGKAFRAAFQNMQSVVEKEALRTKPSDYLDRYATSLRLPVPLVNVAKHVADATAQFDSLVSKQPRTICGAALLLVASYPGVHVDIEDIAVAICKTTGVKLATLGTTHKTFVNIQDQLLPPDFHGRVERGDFAAPAGPSS